MEPRAHGKGSVLDGELGGRSEEASLSVLPLSDDLEIREPLPDLRSSCGVGDEVRADPKPSARFQATTLQWVELRKQKMGPCRVCGQVPTTLHHLVSRSLRGSDVVENLVPLCGSGTHGCHGAVEARRPDALKALRENLRVEEVKYILDTKGEDFLSRYYGNWCPDCGERIINRGAHYEACGGPGGPA
jgi:hypothetical protein